MSAAAAVPSLEVLRFVATPVSADVVLLGLEGRFSAPTRRRLGVPRLVAEGEHGPREVPPATADEARAEPEGSLWRATYAVAFELFERGRFSLAIGRELLLELPAPDAAGATRDREVRLAREANALRRTADEAREAAAAALASIGQERGAREAAESEVLQTRLTRDDLARRVAGLEEELAALRREHAAELVRRDEEHAAELARRDEEREAALSVRDFEAARMADERLADVEAETAEARRALKAARADAEALRRELEHERERAAMAEAVVPRGRVTELAGEPVGGEPVADRPTTRIGEVNGAADVDAVGDEGAPAITDEEPLDEALEPPTTAVPAEDADENAATRVHEPVEGDPGETVRVLGARRPRRSGSGQPADAAPGTAAIGARHIEPGQASQHSAPEAWMARALAFAALAVAVIALLAVLRAF